MAKIFWLLIVLCFGTQVPAWGRDVSTNAHLIPAGPNFDTDGFYSKTYAAICERMLFTDGDWVIRYHGVSPTSEIGISITNNRKDQYFLIVKESTPPIGSTVSSAMNFGVDLHHSLEALKVQERRVEIPKDTALAIHNFWLRLLSELRPREKPLHIVGDHELLFAKTRSGQILRGRLPPDAFKYDRLVRVLAIVEGLSRISGEKTRNQNLLRRIEQNATTR
jgi:hypothetical protein